MNRTKSYQGLLFVGDPHIEGRCPDFRADDYPNVILSKIRWCLELADAESLLPVFLGDLFDKPRDNPTWLLGGLIEVMLGRNAIGIYGNHDCAEPALTGNDSLSILLKAGCLELISEENVWRGEVCGRPAIVGGTSYRHKIPESVSRREFMLDTLFPADSFGVWITHHDIAIGDYEGGRFTPFEIENIDLLVNGHIHTRSEPVVKGETTWMNPGNISRRSRSEKCRVQEPAVLKVVPDANGDGFSHEYITIPHEPFEKIFHEAAVDEAEEGASAFVAGLSELRMRKTSSGAGLKSFLHKNLNQFSKPVAREIMALATEVTGEQFEGAPQ